MQSRPFAAWLAITLSVAVGFGLAQVSIAAPTAEQAKQMQAAEAALAKASNLAKGKQFEESGKLVAQSQQLAAQLSDVREFAPRLARLNARLQQAHRVLGAEGVKLPPLAVVTETPANAKGAAPKGAAAKEGAPVAAALPTKDVSFKEHIAPIMVGKCGRCHISAQRGEFSMATFASIEKGAENNRVFFAGKADGSRLVEVIETGAMPPAGRKVTAEELATLKSWINEGAKYDGQSKDEKLTDMAPGSISNEPTRLTAAAPVGTETVSFKKDIAPILVTNCFDCHGPSRQQNGGRLSLETFAGLLRGGDTGLAITPGEPAESLLINKLKGLAGDRMPLRRRPLADTEIAKIEKWIAEGAAFDGFEPGQSLDVLVATMRALNATHQQLSDDREALARKNWQTAIFDEKPRSAKTTNFFILGNLDQASLDKFAKLAEQQAAAVGKILKAPSGQPLVKGHITLFVFRQRFDYSEWNKVIEQRETPAEMQAHWKYNIIDAYASIYHPTTGDSPIESQLAQQIAAVYVSSLGQVPSWFAEGTARMVTAKLHGRDTRVRGWNDTLTTAMSSTPNAAGFLNNRLSPEQNDLFSYGFVKVLMSGGGKFYALLGQLRQGNDFEQALAKQYGGTAEELVRNWLGPSAYQAPAGKRAVPGMRGRR